MGSPAPETRQYMTQETGVVLFGANRKGYDLLNEFNQLIADRILLEENLLERVLDSFFQTFQESYEFELHDQTNAVNALAAQIRAGNLDFSDLDDKLAATDVSFGERNPIEDPSTFFDPLLGKYFSRFLNFNAKMDYHDFVALQISQLTTYIEPPCWKMIDYINSAGNLTRWSNGYRGSSNNWQHIPDHLYQMNGVWFTKLGDIQQLSAEQLFNYIVFNDMPYFENEPIYFASMDGEINLAEQSGYIATTEASKILSINEAREAGEGNCNISNNSILMPLSEFNLTESGVKLASERVVLPDGFNELAADVKADICRDALSDGPELEPEAVTPRA